VLSFFFFPVGQEEQISLRGQNSIQGESFLSNCALLDGFFPSPKSEQASEILGSALAIRQMTILCPFFCP